MINFLSIVDTIGTEVNNFINNYLNLGVNAFNNLDWWIKVIILVALVIILVLGIIKFVEISWKLFLVLIVLGGIAAAVYFLVIKPGETTTTVEAIRVASNFLQLIL